MNKDPHYQRAWKSIVYSVHYPFDDRNFMCDSIEHSADPNYNNKDCQNPKVVQHEGLASKLQFGHFS